MFISWKKNAFYQAFQNLFFCERQIYSRKFDQSGIQHTGWEEEFPLFVMCSLLWNNQNIQIGPYSPRTPSSLPTFQPDLLRKTSRATPLVLYVRLGNPHYTHLPSRSCLARYLSAIYLLICFLCANSVGSLRII